MFVFVFTFFNVYVSVFMPRLGQKRKSDALERRQIAVRQDMGAESQTLPSERAGGTLRQ